MKKITINGLMKLKSGTVIIQLYHIKSLDGSKFDINVIKGDKIILLESVGGVKLHSKLKEPPTITEVADMMRYNKKIQLYIADEWLQRLFKWET